jgi:biotin operon repressor
MLYEHSQEIAERVEHALRLIETGTYSTQTLAVELGLFVPTASRMICALRQRGYSIRSVKNGRVWAYRLERSPDRTTQRQEARHA